jgi:AcrR family transcriptional regulator
MPRKTASVPEPPRRRRTADEARTAILDAAEKRLAESGPSAIRLQEVAADVGVSHPTVLHHFGSREALVEAVVRRALDGLHAALLAAVQASPESTDQVRTLLDAVFDTLATRGHGRTFLWLALSGYAPGEDLRVQSVAEAVHAIRCSRHKGRRKPSFEDTYFTVLLPALALLSMSVGVKDVAADDDPLGPASFRRWLAALIHDHLDT